jgi:hypothetical protein
MQPLFKRVFNRIIGFRQSRSPYYYYGGRNSLPGLPVVEIDRDLQRDSIDTLGAPIRAYRPLKNVMDNGLQDRVISDHTPEEEETRAQIRALSSPASVYSQPVFPSSVYSIPGSSMRPNNFLGAD